MTQSSVTAARRWRKVLSSGSAAPGGQGGSRVVFVCTGNRFRSPLAAALFGKSTSRERVTVDSAGTLQLGHVSALPEAIEHASRLGVDLTDHSAQSIDDLDLRFVDLVVGFERIHVTTAVVEAGAPRERTFTLPELVDLLELGPHHADARTAIEAADATRRRANQSDLPEIRDPLRKGQDVQREIADEIARLVARLVPLLGLS